MIPFRVTALVVRKVDYGEADRIFTLLSPERGKLSAMARGARRSRRRYGSEMGLFSLGEAELAARRSGDLYDLRDWEMLNPHFELGSELGRTVHASYVCEVAREFFGAEHAEPEAFSLVTEALAVLATAEVRAAVLRAFELRFLDTMGLGPVLERCIGCGAAATSTWRYDAHTGGIRCFLCAKTGIPMAEHTRLLLLQARSAESLAGAADALGPRQATANGAGEADDELARDGDALRRILRGTVEQHLGRPLRSVAFVEKLHAGAADIFDVDDGSASRP